MRLSPRSGNGVAWVEGTEFHSGTIEVDIRDRERLQQNYVGIAFYRKNDTTYETIYPRPFNFRAGSRSLPRERNRSVHAGLVEGHLHLRR